MAEHVRALLIEGHPAVLRALSRRLQSDLNLVGIASEPAEALAWVASTQPRVILLGLQHEHRRHPTQVADLIRQLRAVDVVVVVLVGYADVVERELYLQAGASRYLLKYINTQSLLSEILAAVTPEA